MCWPLFFSDQVETYSKALVGDELIEKIRDVHVIGIRSKTKLTKQVLAHAKNLLAIGCFCIGTNQVDLQAAAKQGVSYMKFIVVGYHWMGCWILTFDMI